MVKKLDMNSVHEWTKEDWLQYRQVKLDEMPPKMLKKAVDVLKKKLTEKTKVAIQKAWKVDPANWIAGYHFGWGMSIRNLLRDAGLKDEKLPDKNWDDYYTVCVEIAVGVRPYPEAVNPSKKSK